VNCSTVRVPIGVEFDIDIHHHWCGLKWCWLKWRDSLRCSLMPAVKPRECCERAQDHGQSRHLPPLLEANVLIEPPKQHSTPNGEPGGGPGEIVLHQRNPENSPQYWAQEPARAAPALAIASTATVNSNFFIVVVLFVCASPV
jgi:hypothetical protein